MALTPAKELIFEGSGWGALENERRAAYGESLLSPHLDFGKTGPAQKQWQQLLTQGSFGEQDSNAVPTSWMRQEEWLEQMEQAVNGIDKENWYAWMQLGCTYLAERQFRLAKDALEKSMELQTNCWALYALACLEKTNGNQEKAGRMMLKAAQMTPSDISLAVAAARYLHEACLFKENLAFIEGLDDTVAENSRIRMYYSYALLRTGDINRAEELLYADGGINVADIREAEVTITELWVDLEEAKAIQDGRIFDRATAIPPRKFDFRMHASERAK